MGRAPCCDKANVKKGPWSPEEDAKLKNFIETNGTGGNWITLPTKAGLKRCGKSCRLRWINYLRPDIKHGGFTEEEEETIYRVHADIGSRWSVIAQRLPGRTDNDIKNYWNTRLKKKLAEKGMNMQCRQQLQRNYQNVMQNVQNLSAVQNFTGAHTECSSEDLYQQLLQSQTQYYPQQSYNAMSQLALPQLTQQVTPPMFSHQQQQHFAQEQQQFQDQQQEQQNMMLAMDVVDELVNGPTSTIPSAGIDESSLLRIESSFKSCIAPPLECNDSSTSTSSTLPFQQSPGTVPMSPATVLADISRHRSPTSPCSDSYGNSYDDSIRSGASQSLALLPIDTNVEPLQSQHVPNGALTNNMDDGLLDTFSVVVGDPFEQLSVKEEYSTEWSTTSSWNPSKGPITLMDRGKCHPSTPRCGAENVFSAPHLAQMQSMQEQPHDYGYLKVEEAGVSLAPEAAFADQLPFKDNNMAIDTERESLREVFFRQAELSSVIKLPSKNSNMAIDTERQEEQAFPMHPMPSSLSNYLPGTIWLPPTHDR